MTPDETPNILRCMNERNVNWDSLVKPKNNTYVLFQDLSNSAPIFSEILNLW